MAAFAAYTLTGTASSLFILCILLRFLRRCQQPKELVLTR